MKTAVLSKNGQCLVGEVELATSLRRRMVGLLGRTGLGSGRGMYLSPCNSIHTFMMKFSLDLIFVDGAMNVTKIVRAVEPGRMVMGGLGAHAVVELESGWLPAEALAVGDHVTLEPQSSDHEKN